MAGRYNKNYIVQSGKFKGYRIEDADDAYWSVGYTLPTLPNYQDWRMRTFCIKSVSDNHINIERLPTKLRTLVNVYHAEFGVGKVKNLETFSIRCCNHPDESKRKCRQCRARRDAAKMTLQKKLKIEVTHGLLVRTGWQPPKEDDSESKKEGVVKIITTAPNITKRTMKTNWKRVEQEVVKGSEEPSNSGEPQVKDREREKQKKIRELIDHRPTVIAMGGKGSYVEESSTRTEVEETLVTGYKATGKVKEKGCHWEQKTSREVASQTEKETLKGERKPSLHYSKQKGTYPCEICGREYQYKRNLSRHVKEQHETQCEELSEEQSDQAILCNSSLMGNRPVLRCVRLSKHAQMPTRGTYWAAGHDLYSAYDYTIRAGEQALIKTDLQIALPPGCYGRIASRSSLAHPHGIDVGAGVIDPDYQGNVGIVLFNLGQEDYNVRRGDRCAQILLEQIYVPLVVEVEHLDKTGRGMGSFGSTGK